MVPPLASRASLSLRVELHDLLFGTYSMPRSVKASRMLWESSFVIGTGAAIGPTTRISIESLTPRSTK